MESFDSDIQSSAFTTTRNDVAAGGAVAGADVRAANDTSGDGGAVTDAGASAANDNDIRQDDDEAAAVGTKKVVKSTGEHVGTAQCDAVASLVGSHPSSSPSSSAATSSIVPSSATTTPASASSAAAAAAAGAQASSRGGWLGFAFLHFRDKTEAADAIETLGGQMVHNGSTMRLQWADAHKGATKKSDPTTPRGETTLNVQHLLVSSANDS
jgi:hypothetical protein